jgi:hypothetical protein
MNNSNVADMQEYRANRPDRKRNRRSNPDFEYGVETRQRIVSHAVMLGRSSVWTYDREAAIEPEETGNDSEHGHAKQFERPQLTVVPGPAEPELSPPAGQLSMAPPPADEPPLQPTMPMPPAADAGPAPQISSISINEAQRNVMASFETAPPAFPPQMATVTNLDDRRAARLTAQQAADEALDVDADPLQEKFRQMNWQPDEGDFIANADNELGRAA